MSVELSSETNNKIQDFFKSLPLENMATEAFSFLLKNRRLQLCELKNNSLSLVWAGECDNYGLTIRHIRQGDGKPENRATFAMRLIKSDGTTIKVVDDNLKEILTGDRLNPLLHLQGVVAGITLIPGININIRDLNIISDIRLSD